MSSGNSTNGEYAELRELLVGPERQQIGEILEILKRRTAVTPGDVGEVLPQAILERATRDTQLRNSLQPVLTDAIRAFVRTNPDLLSELLFPVIGKAVRQAVANALQGMVENLNQVVETSFSVRSLQWRLEAMRSGKSFGEIALVRSLLYRVEQVFLIHNATGLLLQHVISQSTAIRDPDMVSGMLTAIQNFVEDSFGGARDSLEMMRVGDVSVWIQHGPHALLAAVVRGTPPPALGTVFSAALETIHHDCKEQLEAFHGDSESLVCARPQLERCLLGQSPEAKRNSLTPVYVLCGVLAIVIAVWAFFAIRDQRRWDRYLAALYAQPGIVVTDQARHWRSYSIAGLRDPLAHDPNEFLAAAGVPRERVVAAWSPYLSLEPQLVAAREFSELKQTLEGQKFEFAPGQAALGEAHVPVLANTAQLVRRLQDAAGRAGRTFQVEVVGRADGTGTAELNAQLSRERSAEVVSRLVSLGADRGLFSQADEWGSQMDRTVRLRVIAAGK